MIPNYFDRDDLYSSKYIIAQLEKKCNYSYLNASIGSNFAALLAGKTPKPIPMAAETPTAKAIEYNGTLKIQTKPALWAINEINQPKKPPSTTPKKPPITVTKTDS